MTDQSTRLDGRIEDIDLTEQVPPAPDRTADLAGIDPMVGDEIGGDEDGGDEDGARDRAKVAAMIAGGVALALGVLLGMRRARRRRSDTTVVIIDEPEAARWRRLVRRGGVATAA